MKVVAVLYSSPPHRTVGGEMMTLRLMDNLAARGHQVSVVARTFTSPGRWKSVPIIPGHTTGEISSLEALNSADVVVTHPELLAWTHQLTRAVMRKPIVAIVHNLENWTLRSLVAYPDTHVVANTVTTASALVARKIRSARDIAIVYPPVEVIDAPVPGLPREFVTLVNLSEDKGGKVFDALASAFPDVPFLGVLGGHGEQMYSRVSDRVPENVTLFRHGPLNLPLHLTKVLIAPSRTETYNMVACEAMMLGIPVIASDLPAHRESLGESSELVDAEDIDAWQSALQKVLYDNDELLGAQQRAHEHSIVLRDRLSKTYDTWESVLLTYGSR